MRNVDFLLAICYNICVPNIRLDERVKGGYCHLKRRIEVDNKNKTNRELFAQALCEVLCKEYDEDLANCTEDATVSDSHKMAMNKIFKDAGYDFVPYPEMNENNE